jgi:flagellar motility protein MotE (MotC chaperone)
VLSKLNPRAASGILGEMPAEKAAKLSTLIAGAPGADKS